MAARAGDPDRDRQRRSRRPTTTSPRRWSASRSACRCPQSPPPARRQPIRRQRVCRRTRPATVRRLAGWTSDELAAPATGAASRIRRATPGAAVASAAPTSRAALARSDGAPRRVLRPAGRAGHRRRRADRPGQPAADHPGRPGRHLPGPQLARRSGGCCSTGCRSPSCWSSTTCRAGWRHWSACRCTRPTSPPPTARCSAAPCRRCGCSSTCCDPARRSGTTRWRR